MRDVIVALDFPNKKEAIDFLKQFDQPIYTKVGMELYYAEGPDIIREILQLGHKVFLDLKIHDIPNTAKSAIKALSKFGVNMVNCHIAGGSEMISEVAKASSDTLAIGVTMLTSTDKKIMNEDILIEGEVEDAVLKYAQLAKRMGLDGVVCSAMEVPKIKKALGKDFITVTPGIRRSASSDDQKRVVTPKLAGELGSDFIVVGRPIRNAKNPVEEYKEILKEFLEA